MALGYEAMKIALMLAGPPLIAALVSGLIVSMLQAATQINEMTLSFIPKVLTVFFTLVVAGPWMLSVILDYMRAMFSQFPNMIG
jgi:flagellar biosynthetic protein FliQ